LFGVCGRAALVIDVSVWPEQTSILARRLAQGASLALSPSQKKAFEL